LVLAASRRWSPTERFVTVFLPEARDRAGASGVLAGSSVGVAVRVVAELAGTRRPRMFAELDGPTREVKLLVDHRRDLVAERPRIQADRAGRCASSIRAWRCPLGAAPLLRPRPPHRAAVRGENTSLKTASKLFVKHQGWRQPAVCG